MFFNNFSSSRSADKLSLIFQSLKHIETEVENLNEKVEDLTFNQKEHIGDCNDFQDQTESSLDTLSSKVIEIRQIVGSTAMSNGKGIVSNSSPQKERKNPQKSRNRSRSPSKKVKSSSSGSSENSVEVSEKVVRGKRSKSPQKQIRLQKDVANEQSENESEKYLEEEKIKQKNTLAWSISQENMNFDNQKLDYEDTKITNEETMNFIKDVSSEGSNME